MWQRKENPLHWLARKSLVCDEATELLPVLCEDREIAAVALNTRNVVGETPLMIAAQVGHPGVIRAMLRYGGNPTVMTNNGSSPLTVISDATPPCNHDYRKAIKVVAGGTLCEDCVIHRELVDFAIALAQVSFSLSSRVAKSEP